MPSYTLASQSDNNVLTDSVEEYYFKVKNTGSDTWNKTGTGRVLLGTQAPQDHDCIFRDPDDARWSTSTNGHKRIVMEETTVAPNQFATFRFNVAPQETADGYPKYNYSEEHFKVCREGVGWFTGPDLYETFRNIKLENPYSGEDNAFKGQIHAHTNVSDGDQSPSAVVTAYKDAGYDFIAITDHNFQTPDPEVADITFIPGLESGSGRPHLIVLDDIDVPMLTSSKGHAARHSGAALISIAHPNMSGVNGMTQTELDAMADFHLLEVYNGKMDTAAEITARAKFMSVYGRGRKAWCVAVDDSHTASDRDKGWIVVHAASNSKADILDAIRRGDFYASTGSDLTITVDGNVVTATSPHAGTFRFVDSDYTTPLKLATNTAGGSASYTVQGTGNCVWVVHQKTGSDGITNAAWAQPIFVRKAN